jgi:hypothetical protein
MELPLVGSWAVLLVSQSAASKAEKWVATSVATTADSVAQTAATLVASLAVAMVEK